MDLTNRKYPLRGAFLKGCFEYLDLKKYFIGVNLK